MVRIAEHVVAAKARCPAPARCAATARCAANTRCAAHEPWVVRERARVYATKVVEREQALPESAPTEPARPLTPEEEADELTVLADRCAATYMASDALQYEAMVLLAEFDEREGWRHTGFGSSAEWLSWRIGIGLGAARERVRAARALRELPLISAAMQGGELSFTKVRALTRVAAAESEAALLEFARSCSAARLEQRLRSWTHESRTEEASSEARRHECRKLSVFPDDDGMYVVRGRLDPETGALLMRAIEAAGDALWRRDGEGADDHGRAKGDSPSPEHGSVSPEHGAVSSEHDAVSPEQRRADAIALVAERALAAGFGGAAGPDGTSDRDGASVPLSGSRAERYQVVLHVEPETLRSAGPASGEDVSAETSDPAMWGPEAWGQARATAQAAAEAQGTAKAAAARRPLSQLGDGMRVSAETSRRLSCDASVVRVAHARVHRDGGPVAGDGRTHPFLDAAVGGGRVLDVGRRTRTIPPALRRALEARDGGCRHPGCGSRFTDAHHIEHWADGGETSLQNLVLLCRRHHRAVHEGRVQVCRGADDSVAFFTPDGRVLYDAPPRAIAGAGERDGRVGSRVGSRPVEPRLDLPSWRTGAARWASDRDVPWGLEVKALAAIEKAAGW